MNFAAHIGKLVLEHECVIIPGLGGFLTNYHAAEINSQQHHILPPTRKLVFNSQLNGNDGLLANYLSERLNISYKTSLLLLELFADYCHRDLAEGKQIAFGDLGILDMNNHHKLEFYPNTTINYNEDAFGLKALALKTVEHKPDFSFHAPLQKAIVKPRTAKVVKLNTAVIRKIAAVLIPLVILMSAAFYVPTLVRKNNLQQTSVFSFLDSLTSTIFSNEKLDNPDDEVTIDEMSNIHVLDNRVANEEVDSGLNAIESEAIEVNPTEFIIHEQNPNVPIGQFHIICGSFLEKDRAEAMVNSLKAEGFTAYVAGQSNLGTYRVSIQSFTNVQDASRQIKWVRNQGYEKAWILNKTF